MIVGYGEGVKPPDQEPEKEVPKVSQTLMNNAMDIYTHPTDFSGSDEEEEAYRVFWDAKLERYEKMNSTGVGIYTPMHDWQRKDWETMKEIEERRKDENITSGMTEDQEEDYYTRKEYENESTETPTPTPSGSGTGNSDIL